MEHMTPHLFDRLRRRSRPNHSEAGASAVEYVGLGAVSAMLVSGLAAAIDSHAGDRVATAIVRRLIEVVSGS
jgi:hypothetical protein